MDFLKKPTTDFAAVRDGRRSLPFWLDIDLTGARSIAAGSALSINIAGNSFYVDQDTANVGNATVHFQDTNLGASSAPLFVSAGFIANVPFTQILIENTAQAGKRLRIFYGVDIDFQAGINASIAISGAVQVNNTLAQKIPMYQAGAEYSSSYKSTTLLAVNTPETIIAPGANVNGIIIHLASFYSVATSLSSKFCLIAKTSAPANVSDGEVILQSDCVSGFSSAILANGSLKNALKIAAGKGIYAICEVAESSAQRSMLYTIL